MSVLPLGHCPLKAAVHVTSGQLKAQQHDAGTGGDRGGRV